MTPNRRATDTDTVARLAENAKRYGIFWLPLLWLVGSLGFSLITPKVTVAQLKTVFDSETGHLQREIDANHIQAVRTDSAIMEVHGTLTNQMTMLLKHACLDKYMPSRDKLLIGLPCTELFLKDPP